MIALSPTVHTNNTPTHLRDGPLYGAQSRVQLAAERGELPLKQQALQLGAHARHARHRV
jgi:hypothetical protein